MGELPREEVDDGTSLSLRRAILKAFASAPVILTLAAGPARAHTGASLLSPCEDPPVPPPPPPGCGTLEDPPVGGD